jgi:hypothetical protein
MPHSKTSAKRTPRRDSKRRTHQAANTEVRYTVGLTHVLANQVERYAETVDLSRSKAIAALVRLGLEGQEMRKREFFKKLRANLDDDNPAREDELIDEFQALILGR